jgi:hypothetical protein
MHLSGIKRQADAFKHPRAAERFVDVDQLDGRLAHTPISM